jgi:Protein of unknown function (DUF1499)
MNGREVLMQKIEPKGITNNPSMLSHYLKSKSLLLDLLVVVIVMVINAAAAYQPTTQQSQFARRDFIVQTGSAAATVAAACLTIAVSTPTVSYAAATTTLDACPKGSSNCIRTTWTAPAGTSRSEMAKTLTAVLESYPQTGQADVDKGGWTFMTNDLAVGASGTASLEYKSGIGNFAKFLNGGKPFVDDLKLQIDDDTGIVQVRSSSRVGESDFNVNQKRLQYLVNTLKSQYGWDAPDPKY